jgi:PIN like domain
LRVLIDHNISPPIARAIHALVEPDDVVVALRDRFPVDVTDLEWIKALGDEGGWAVISGDRRISRNKAEREAWRSCRLTGFFLSAGLQKTSILRLAARLLLLWEIMRTQYSLVEAGAIFELPVRSTKLRQIRL